MELLADRLTDALPADFATAAKVLWATLDSPQLAGWMTAVRHLRRPGWYA